MIVRTLFMKIYLWFWLGMLLVLGIVSAVAVRHSGGMMLSDWRDTALKTLSLSGAECVNRYQSQGLAGLQPILTRARQQGIQLYLFRSGAEVTGAAVPPPVAQVADAAYRDNRHHFVSDNSIVLVAVPAAGGDRSYVIVEQTQHGSTFQRLSKNAGFVSFKILYILIISTAVCFALSRYLTSPITRIRDATRRFSNGELNVRVASEFGSRRDEVTELAADFDAMAGRIEQLMASQTQLLADISHELRSPLARLNFALELSRQEAGEPAQRNLDRIGREAERLNELIGHLLALARLETGLPAQGMVPVDLAALIAKVATDADFEAKRRDSSVEVTASEKVTVIGVPELLLRAIENVVRNGVRHTEEGSCVTMAMALEGDPSSGSVVLTVHDGGPGVPEKALESIFQPFFRADEARDRQTGGLGLGLAIAERAIRLHSGSIRAFNAGSGGLVVEIRLPASEKRPGEPGP